MKLAREQIIDEAIAVMKSDGLSEVSLRKVAGRLDATAPALARHVGNKGHLLALMSHRMFIDAIESIPPGLTGKEWFNEFGRALWNMQHDMRDTLALIGSKPWVPELEDDIADRLVASMDDAGLNHERGHFARRSIQAMVTGWTSLAAGHARFAPGTPGNEEFKTIFFSGMNALLTGFGF